MATWTSKGIDRFTGPGKISFCGSIFYRATSTGGGKLSFLKNLVGVFEYEADEEGNSSVKRLLKPRSVFSLGFLDIHSKYE
jgi:hypothetical protein